MIDKMVITITRRGTEMGLPRKANQEEYEITVFIDADGGETLHMFPDTQVAFLDATAEALRALANDGVVRFIDAHDV